MSTRLTAAQYRALEGRARSNKYHAKAALHDGMRFDSTLERDRYRYWLKMRKAGQIAFVLRQVPFHLPGGIIYRLDFLIRWSDRYTAVPVTYEDCKGIMTPVSKLKIAQAEALYGIQIDIITRKECRA